MNEEKQHFVYGCSHRPPMYGTVPVGFSVVEDLERLPSQHGLALFDYGFIRYDRPLRPLELYSYQLTPVAPEPVLPLYPVGTLCKFMPKGWKGVIELDKYGEYWCGDEVLTELRDWLRFVPVNSLQEA